MANTIQFPSALEKQFFTRIFSTSQEIYDQRIEQIKFTNQDLVLDAGCGYGQWTRSLSDLNKQVYGIDLDANKLKIAQTKNTFKKNNVKFYQGSIEKMPFENETFDCIFSYSVLYWTDYRKTIKEFFRVLKPSGVLYFVTNGIGWSLYNLFYGHSSAPNFNARTHALKTIFSTLKFSITKTRDVGQSHFMSSGSIKHYLKKTGFKNLKISDEGYLNLNNSSSLNPFYKKKFFGTTNVFEVMAKK